MGSSENCGYRWRLHAAFLKGNNHAYQKEFESSYKDQTLAFFVLKKCAPEKLLELEQKYMELFPLRVNRSPNADHSGFKHTPEWKEQRRLFGLRRTQSDAAKKKISIANTGKKHPPRSQEHREKLRLANLGKKRSPETCMRIRLAWKRRKGIIKHSLATPS